MQPRENASYFCGRAVRPQVERRILRQPILLLVIATYLAPYSAAATWVVVLKNGARVECAAPFLVANGVYMFRDTGGKNQSFPAEDVDISKTAAANAAIEAASSASEANKRSSAIRAPSEGNLTGIPGQKAELQKPFRLNAKAALYLLPLGSEAVEDTTGLAEYLHDALGLTAQTLPVVDLDERHWNQQRLQWNAEGILHQLRANQAKLGGRPNAVVIGVTASDIYIPSIDWRYAFAYRQSGGFAVLSSARLCGATWEHQTPTDELRVSRLRKVLLKQVGLLYYHLPLSRDPRSVLYSEVLGVEELDRMEPRF
jgi:predicted Zn-dependent protease